MRFPAVAIAAAAAKGIRARDTLVRVSRTRGIPARDDRVRGTPTRDVQARVESASKPWLDPGFL